MDITKIVKDRVAALTDGDHKVGLSAVVRHIEVAEEHLGRGNLGDNSAFTDAVYRSNQAFEGGLKEAYRVLTKKDPAKKSPHEIENYLTTNSILRDRVVSELTNFRREWRNPATHDYKLDFDSSEALLAITYVCVFTYVILDQVIEQNAKVHAKGIASLEFEEFLLDDDKSEEKFIDTLLGVLASQILSVKLTSKNGVKSESDAIGTIAGYIEGIMQNIQVKLHQSWGETNYIPDISIAGEGVVAVVEYLHSTKNKSYLIDFIWNLDQAAAIEGIQLIFIVTSADESEREITEIEGAAGTKFYIISNKSLGRIVAEEIWAGAPWK